MQWRGRSTSQPMDKKGDMGQTKEEKAYTQVVSSPKKKYDAKNEDPKPPSRRKS